MTDAIADTTTTYQVWIKDEDGYRPVAILGITESLALFAHSVTAGQPIVLTDPNTGRVIYRFDANPLS